VGCNEDLFRMVVVIVKNAVQFGFLRK
jgi:hypothetical protein